MTTTPQSLFETRLRTLRKAVEAGEVSETDADAIESVMTAYHPNKLAPTPPGDDSTVAVGTCNTYAARLTEAARSLSLAQADADAVNAYLQRLHEDESLAASTVSGHAKALRKFYGYPDHEVTAGGPDPGDIATVPTPSGPAFDPDDVLTPEERHELLEAAGNPRDNAVVALLVYTGMRNGCLRTLRVRDVDLDADREVWSPNDSADVDGLKGEEMHGNRRRPLLGAAGPVREWLKFHPTGNPDHYLITARPAYNKTDPTEPMTGGAIRGILADVSAAADSPAIQEKPTHPHMMRHNFVTMLKREYDMPNSRVKRLIGHSPGSDVMETTYSHLSDDDLMAHVYDDLGIGDDDEADASPLTPPHCGTCGHPLPPHAKACQECGAVYAPDARGLADGLEAAATETAAESDDEAAREVARAVREVAGDDPEAVKLFREFADALADGNADA